MTAEPNALGDSYARAFTPGSHPRDWTVVVQGLGRKLHQNVTVGIDPIDPERKDFLALSDASGEIVARYQRSMVVAVYIEPPDEPQQQR